MFFPLFLLLYHVEMIQCYHLLHELSHELAPVTPQFCGFVLLQLGAESISFIDAKQSLCAVDKGTNLRGVGLRHKPFASCMPLLVFGFFWWRLTYWTALRSFTSSLLRSLNSADGHV